MNNPQLDSASIQEVGSPMNFGDDLMLQRKVKRVKPRKRYKKEIKSGPSSPRHINYDHNMHRTNKDKLNVYKPVNTSNKKKKLKIKEAKG
mmetsp:Transcript_28771/g.28480  ORF Transcript_28771/g.28480 Transcript_28771/m.28480 type:complete len:90 (-) Transcript_28771:7-276(-)